MIPSPHKIIGLVGKKGSGKDTVFNIICELYNLRRLNLRPTRVAFADELKQELADAFGTTAKWINERKSDKIVRRSLQELGSIRREEDLNYWIHRTDTKCNDIIKNTNDKAARLFVITDVRYHNEADWIFNQHGKLMRITRPTDDVLDKHSSEIELEKIPCNSFVSNDGSIRQLSLPVEYALQQMGII